MSYPNLVTPVNASPTSVSSSPVPAATANPQTIPLSSNTRWYEVDANGYPTTNKLGQSGPFVIEIDSEKILCSTLVNGVAYVYQDGTTNGRAPSP